MGSMYVPARKMAAFVQQGRQQIRRDFETPPDEEEELQEIAEAEDREAKQAAFDVKKKLEAEETDEQIEKLMAGYDPASGPPAWAVDLDEWQRAINAVEPDDEEGEEDFEEPWLAVAYVYVELGGEIDEDAGRPEDGDEQE